MARRSAEATRRLILDSALQLLLERGVSAGVQHIRLQEVLRSVGLTTGAAYRIWVDQDEFHRDLAVEMVRLRFAPPAASAARAVTSATTFDDVIRAAALDHVSYTERFHLEPESRMSHAFITALALRTAAGAWPELRDAAVERHRESVDSFAAFYGDLMERFGYRMRTPFTIHHLAETLAALGEGFAVRAAEGLDHPFIEVGEDDEAPAGSWTLLGISIRAVADMFLVSIDDATPGVATPDRPEPNHGGRGR